MKPKYTIFYSRNGQISCVTCRSSKRTGEVLFAFHKFMQNNNGNSPDSYKVERIERGERFAEEVTRRGITSNDEELKKMKTPDVSGSGETREVFQ